MTKDEVLKEFRELLSQYTGEAITGHYNGETQQKMESLLSQAEARGREIVVEMVESFKSEVREASPADDYERGYDHGWDDCKADLLTKLKEDSHD